MILAPFNSTIAEEPNRIDHNLFVEKIKALKFSNRCREIDRQYENNNNGQLDNGVYHKKHLLQQQNSFENEPNSSKPATAQVSKANSPTSINRSNMKTNKKSN